MKSSIKIDVDFEHGNQPVIIVKLYENSEDIRDRLLKTFFQNLEGSRYCKLLVTSGYVDMSNGAENNSTWYLTPIKGPDLVKTAKEIMDDYHIPSEKR